MDARIIWGYSEVLKKLMLFLVALIVTVVSG